METASPARSGRMPLVVLAVVVIVLGAGFGYYYVQSSGTILTLNRTVSSQSSHIAADAVQIFSDTASIAKDNSMITNLTATVAADKAKINVLTSGFMAANQTIGNLNTQIAGLNAQVNKDVAQITTLTTQVALLEVQVTLLQAVAGLTMSTVMVNSQSFTTSANGEVQVVSFAANFAGYIAVTATAASDSTHEGPETYNTFSSSINSPNYGSMYIPFKGYFYVFSSIPNTVVIPILPGAVVVYLLTSDLTAQTATLTVTYYY